MANPPNTSEEAIKVYQEGLDSMIEGNYLYASKKFSEAEGMLPQIDWASKSALMSSYCLYNINFYDEAILNLQRFVKIYPASPYVSYAHYLIVFIDIIIGSCECFQNQDFIYCTPRSCGSIIG